MNIHRRWVVGMLLGAASGCAVESSNDEGASTQREAIVDGTPTTDPALDAIGGIVFKYAPAHIEDFLHGHVDRAEGRAHRSSLRDR